MRSAAPLLALACLALIGCGGHRPDRSAEIRPLLVPGSTIASSGKICDRKKCGPYFVVASPRPMSQAAFGSSELSRVAKAGWGFGSDLKHPDFSFALSPNNRRVLRWDSATDLRARCGSSRSYPCGKWVEDVEPAAKGGRAVLFMWLADF